MQNETDPNAGTTALLRSIQNGTDAPISYTYDANGNIETISEGGVLQSRYFYDELNQLVREENPQRGTGVRYSYDLGGNLLQREQYDLATGAATADVYSYDDPDWRDKLTAFNGMPITYDAIGNPLSYNGWSYSWQNGRQLASLSNGSTSVQYTYDADGIRTAKTVNGVTTNYILYGSNVLMEMNGTDTIIYDYDESGKLVGMELNGVCYFYVRNGQGDITGLIDNDGVRVVSYDYDTWGNILSINDTSGINLGETNPYRYRGYRYDNETGLYYLQSRYYNPTWGRFINGDDYASTGQGIIGNNMFTYCNNNPVNLYDPSGFLSIIYDPGPNPELAMDYEYYAKKAAGYYGNSTTSLKNYLLYSNLSGASIPNPEPEPEQVIATNYWWGVRIEVPASRVGDAVYALNVIADEISRYGPVFSVLNAGVAGGIGALKWAEIIGSGSLGLYGTVVALPIISWNAKMTIMASHLKSLARDAAYVNSKSNNGVIIEFHYWDISQEFYLTDSKVYPR